MIITLFNAVCRIFDAQGVTGTAAEETTKGNRILKAKLIVITYAYLHCSSKTQCIKLQWAAVILCDWILQHLAVQPPKKISCVGRYLALRYTPVSRIGRVPTVCIAATKEKPAAVTVSVAVLRSASLMNQYRLILITAFVISSNWVLLKQGPTRITCRRPSE